MDDLNSVTLHSLATGTMLVRQVCDRQSLLLSLLLCCLLWCVFDRVWNLKTYLRKLLGIDQVRLFTTTPMQWRRV
jgi:hypothetical protein